MYLKPLTQYESGRRTNDAATSYEILCQIEGVLIIHITDKKKFKLSHRLFPY